MTQTVYLQCGGRRRNGGPCAARLDRIAHDPPTPITVRVEGGGTTEITVPGPAISTDAWKRTAQRSQLTKERDPADSRRVRIDLDAYHQDLERNPAIAGHDGPTLRSGQPGKHVYRCGKCGAEHRVNAARLEEIVLRAIAQRRDVLVFGTDL